MKKAEARFSTLKVDDSLCYKSGNASKRTKSKNCWFEFQGCISDAYGNEGFLDFILDGLKRMRGKMKDMRVKGDCRMEKETIEEMFGPQIDEEVSVHPPNQSNNKGSRKRIIGAAEKSMGGKKRQKRECKTCKEMAYHDSRNCPTKQ